MEKKEEKKKDSALNINDNFDFNFAKKIPKVLRWILVIPVGLLSILAVHLAYGFIVSMFLKNFSETSIMVVIVNAIFGFIKFYIFMISMVAMAPVAVENKFKVGIGLSVVPLVIAGGIMALAMKVSEASSDYIYSTTDMIIQVVAVVLAVIVGLIHIKTEINKKKSLENDMTDSSDT